MANIQNIKAITIEGGKAVFSGYNYIKDIKLIKLSDEQVNVFLKCCLAFNSGLGNLINNELDEAYEVGGIDYLASIIPLVNFREHLACNDLEESSFFKEGIMLFQYLLDETRTWESKGCDLVCISGPKKLEISVGKY